MSYTAIIYGDSPECVWSFDEGTGTTIASDPFIGASTYPGTLESGKTFWTKVPIIFGGKSAITNSITASAGDKLFSLPSLDKFSVKTQRKSCTLEFWMNLDINETELSTGAAVRLEDSKIMGISSYGSSTGLYIRDLDYLVFKLGDSGKRVYESSVHVPNLDQPLHISIIYSSSYIQLIVNGVKGNSVSITDNPFAAYSNNTLDFYLPLRVSSPSFTKIKFDSVAIYSHILEDAIIKKHYVYGLGYNIQKAWLKTNGISYYNTNLQKTTPIKIINYQNKQTWSDSTVFDNLTLTNNNITTYQYNPVFIYNSINKEATNMYSSNGLSFPEDSFSYMQINNYESITGASTKKVEAKFKIDATHNTTGLVQQLMYISSAENPNKYLSFTITNRVINAYVNTPNNPLGSAIASLTLGAGYNDFFISYVYDNLQLKISLVPITGTAVSTTTNIKDLFPMENAYIRFGSAPVFYQNNINSLLTASDSSIKRFDGWINQVDIYNSTSTTSVYANYPTKKISNLYQCYFDGDAKIAKIATKGTFELYISLLDLVGSDKFGTNIDSLDFAANVEIGSQSAEIKYTLNTVADGVETPITGNVNQNIRLLSMPAPGVTGNPKVETIQLKVNGTLYSSDTINNPGVLNYLNITTYPVISDTNTTFDNTNSNGKYIEIVQETPSGNIKYYSGKTGATNHRFKSLPELDHNTDIFRAFYTGITVGTANSVCPFLSIPFNINTTNSINGVTEKIYTVSFSAIMNSGTDSNTKFLKIGSTVVDWTNASLTQAGLEVYINGSLYTTGTLSNYNLSVWNHFTFKFLNGLAYNSATEILIGYQSGSQFSVDNLMVGVGNINSSRIKKIYDILYGNAAERVGYGSTTLSAINIDDSEILSSTNLYQKLGNQSTSYLSAFQSPLYASTKDYPLAIKPLTNITSIAPTYRTGCMYYTSLPHFFEKDETINIIGSSGSLNLSPYTGSSLTITSVPNSTSFFVSSTNSKMNLVSNPGFELGVNGWISTNAVGSTNQAGAAITSPSTIGTSTARLDYASPVAITAISGSGTVATYTAPGHTFVAGDGIVVTGSSIAGYNVVANIASVVAGTSFTVNNATTGIPTVVGCFAINSKNYSISTSGVMPAIPSTQYTLSSYLKNNRSFTVTGVSATSTTLPLTSYVGSSPGIYTTGTSATAHGLLPGDYITISGATGNTAFNGNFTIVSVPTSTTFTFLLTTTGSSAGTIVTSKKTATYTTSATHNFVVGSSVTISGISGGTPANGYTGINYPVRAITTNTFTVPNRTTGTLSGQSGNVNSGPIIMEYTFYTGAIPGAPNRTTITDLSTTWQRKNVTTIAAPVGATGISIRFVKSALLNSGSSSDITYIDSVLLEEGTTLNTYYENTLTGTAQNTTDKIYLDITDPNNQYVDSLTKIATGNIVLFKDETTESFNGIYTVGLPDSLIPSRKFINLTKNFVATGTGFLVSTGSNQNGNKLFQVNSPTSFVLSYSQEKVISINTSKPDAEGIVEIS